MDRTTQRIARTILFLSFLCGVFTTTPLLADTESDPSYIQVTATVADGALSDFDVIDSNLNPRQATAAANDTVKIPTANHIALQQIAAMALGLSTKKLPIDFEYEGLHVVGSYRNGNVTASMITNSLVNGRGSGIPYDPGFETDGRNGGNPGIETTPRDKSPEESEWGTTAPPREKGDLTELY